MREWHARAACRGLTHVMFPERGDTRGQQLARSICMTCPVFDDCAEFAIASNEHFGTWAGMGYTEIRTIRRQRGLEDIQAAHGTRSRYQNGCRCIDCIEAARTYERERKRRHLLSR